MNAPIIARAWNDNSEVRHCATCNGLGVIPAMRRPTIDDPYPEQPCPDCEGEHLPACEVCGFEQMIHGYDCAPCFVIGELSDKELAAFSPMKFAASLMKAMMARRGR